MPVRFQQKAWYGGVSGEKFLGIENSVQSAKNVELRQFPKRARLAKKPTADAGGAIADWVQDFVTIQSTGDVIAFGDTGKIYRQTAGSGNFALVYTDTGNDKILSAVEYNDYLYWTTDTHLHRIAVADIDASWTGDVTEDYKAFTNANTSFHPMIEVYNNLYIGDGSGLAELDSLGTLTGEKITIFGDEAIVGLTFNGSTIRLYAQRTTNVDSSRMYFWNGTSDEYSEFAQFDGKTIHAVQSRDNNDFVIAGRRPALYLVSGFQLSKLQDLPDFADGDDGVVHYNSTSVRDYQLLIGTVESGTNSINRGVWSFGNKNRNYPQVLNNEYTTSNANAADLVGAVHVSGGKVYFGWKNGSSYNIDVEDLSTYAATGEVVHRAWDGGSSEEQKAPLGLKLSFEYLDVGEKIEVFARTDLSAAWGTAVLTVDYDADTADRNVAFKEITKRIDVDRFNFIELRIVLTGDGTSTPSVIGIVLDADFVRVD